jgi:hypothetical protein
MTAARAGAGGGGIGPRRLWETLGGAGSELARGRMEMMGGGRGLGSLPVITGNN